MKYILTFLVFYAFIIFIQYWQIIKLLLLNLIHKFKYYGCTAQDIPNSMKKQLIVGIEQFKQLGFKISHYQKHDVIFAAIKWQKYAAVMWNEQHQCYVVIENHLAPDAIRPFMATFISMHQQKVVMGTYSEEFGVVAGYDGNHIVDFNEIDIELRLTQFLQYLDKYQQEQHLSTRIQYNKNDYIARMNNASSGYIDYLAENKWVVQKSDSYRFKLLAAIKLAFKIKKGTAEVSKLELAVKDKLEDYPDYLQAPEVDAYFRHDKIINHNTFNRWVKTLLFIISVGVFVLLFSSVFSYSLALYLFFVLLFHELGHLLAMKLFGYRDLQVLFLPFGAAVLGKEQDVSVLKKVLVSLAGPVPGIVVAILLFSFGGEQVLDQSWAYQLILMLLIINYFNLLPFMPLDGGQIINQVLFGRYPIAQFAFSVISVAVFVFFAYYFDDTILTIVSLFLFFGLFYQYSNTRLQFSLRHISYKNKTQLIAKVFNEIKDQPLRFSQKFQKIQAVLPSLMQKKAKIHEMVFGLLLYFSALFVPIYLLNNYTNGALWTIFNIQLNGYAEEGEKYEIEYWQKRIDEVDNPEQKFARYVEVLSFINDEDYIYGSEAVLKQGLEFARLHSFQQHEKYPQLLKTVIVSGIWENGEEQQVNQEFLSELKRIDNGQNIEYANALLAIYAYEYTDDSLENLLLVEKIFIQHNKIELLINVKIYIAKNYEYREEYEKAELILTELLNTSVEELEEEILIPFYNRRGRYDDALAICKKSTEQKIQSDLEIYFYPIEKCGWVALFAEHFTQSEDYFTRANKIQKELYLKTGVSDLVEPSYIEGINRYADFNYFINLMVLEWSRENFDKAKMHYQKLVAMSEKNEMLDLARHMQSLEQSKIDEFKKPNKQNVLTLRVYERLKN